MTTRRVLFIVFIFSSYFYSGGVLAAAVEISEVAWMGTSNSAQDEWIELYSVSGANLDGWILKSEDGGMNINLSGSISAGGYFLIERTDDSTVPEVSADLITPFGNGLANSGEVLILLNSSGGEENRIDASGGWPAGDNTTKDTMQKVSGVWQTLIPTPKAPPSGASSVPLTGDNDGTGNSSGSSSGSSGGVSKTEEKPKITADISEISSGIAGAETSFKGTAYGIKGEEMVADRYFWSFGDGSVAEGRYVLHAFRFPGKYQVSLSVVSGGFSASAYREIEITKSPLSITEISQGNDSWVKLANPSSKKIDISGWKIKSAGGIFTFPRETYILADTSLTVPKEISGLSFGSAGEIELLYPSGIIAHSFNLNPGAAASLADTSAPKAKSPIASVQSVSEDSKESRELFSAEEENVSRQTAAAASPGTSKTFYPWVLSALGVGILAAFGFIASKRI